MTSHLTKSLILGGLAAILATLTSSGASAKPRCNSDAGGPPVAQYLDHHCYPGLNTYTSKTQRAKKLVGPTAQLKKKYQQRRMMFQQRQLR